MDENRFDEVVRDLPRNFNAPPPPPLDDMWSVIEDAHFNAPTSIAPRRGRMLRAPWLAAAAALLIGIGIGRYTPRSTKTAANPPSATAHTNVVVSPENTASAVADAYRDQTSHYLGQAAALLISLPIKDSSGRADADFAGKAADLLVTTRLLIDSPAAQDPKLRSLLEDLELVLVQIARLRGGKSTGDLDLIHQAVEQGDVLSRLNSAVVTNQSSE
ncbi:MAG: hypothetical protein M3Z54_07265 [Gemmatimonadota bacterium]|nr:hypothetical protein [Gemmatimonadota bacterium]